MLLSCISHLLRPFQNAREASSLYNRRRNVCLRFFNDKIYFLPRKRPTNQRRIEVYFASIRFNFIQFGNFCYVRSVWCVRVSGERWSATMVNITSLFLVVQRKVDISTIWTKTDQVLYNVRISLIYFFVSIFCLPYTMLAAWREWKYEYFGNSCHLMNV